MKAKSHIPRLFAGCAVCVGFMVLQPCTSQAGTSDTDLSKDLNRSAFSTSSIFSDLTNSNKQLQPAEVTPFSNGRVLASSQPGGFQYDSETRQTTSAHKVTEAIRDTQKMEDQRNAEIAQHPFWYAPFWTHSPLAIAGFLLGGDHHALETPPTEFEKLGAASYGNEAEVRKYELSVGFGNVGRGADR
jgi:hypothetical protein